MCQAEDVLFGRGNIDDILEILLDDIVLGLLVRG